MSEGTRPAAEDFFAEPLANLLPEDGDARYPGIILEAGEAFSLMARLRAEVEWEEEVVKLFGKTFRPGRETVWYGDEGIGYAYSGTFRVAKPWTPALSELRMRVEAEAGTRFNSCLLNYYHHGGEGMGWHSDAEKALDPNAPIASVSLGAERKFSFKHRIGKMTVSLILESGSLLLMNPPTQAHWLHSLPKMKRVAEPRMNLTFRRILTG